MIKKITAIKTRSKLTSAKAFTLIEVLVASAVMVILVGIVAYIASSVMSTWNRSSGKLSANAEARLALDIIAQDLETAVLRNNGMQWLCVEGPAGFKPGAPFTASNSVVLKLFAPPIDRESGDGICAIAYKLEYEPAYTGGPSTYALYRMVVSPTNTLNNYLSSGYDDPTDSKTVQGSLTGDGRNPATWDGDTITNETNYLAGNIVEFKVLIYDSSQTASQPRNGTANNVVDSNYRYGGSDSNAGADVPIYADIILTAVTDEGAELLKTRTINGSSERMIDLAAKSANDVVLQHGKTLIRRVNFKSDPI